MTAMCRWMHRVKRGLPGHGKRVLAWLLTLTTARSRYYEKIPEMCTIWNSAPGSVGCEEVWEHFPTSFDHQSGLWCVRQGRCPGGVSVVRCAWQGAPGVSNLCGPFWLRFAYVTLFLSSRNIEGGNAWTGGHGMYPSLAQLTWEFLAAHPRRSVAQTRGADVAVV
jgi:hypothetical protein